MTQEERRSTSSPRPGGQVWALSAGDLGLWLRERGRSPQNSLARQWVTRSAGLGRRCSPGQQEGSNSSAVRKAGRD